MPRRRPRTIALDPGTIITGPPLWDQGAETEKGPLDYTLIGGFQEGSDHLVLDYHGVPYRIDATQLGGDFQVKP